jgi:uncharacterized protein (TIGR02266 family)
VKGTKASLGSGDGVQAFIEKRRDLRAPLVVLEVKWKKYDKVFIAQAQNISASGLLLASDRDLEVGERFPIEFILPDRKTRVDCTGEVVWIKRYGSQQPGSQGVGVRFVDLDEKKMKAITEWIRRQETAARS